MEKTHRIGPKRVAIALVVGAALVAPGLSGQEAFDVAGMPPEIAAHAELSAQRCGSCHALKRVIKAPYSGDEWRDVVEKMRKKEKSGISAGDAQKIVVFLSAWSDRPAAGGAGTPDPKGAAAPGGSAPGDAAIAAEPPNTAGGVHAWSPRTCGVARLWEIPPDSQLPFHFQALGYWIRVDAIETKTGEAGSPEVVVSGSLDDRGLTMSLATQAASAPQARAETIRTWEIGSHRFDAALGIYRVGLPLEPGRRPQVWLALLSRRD